MVKPGATPRVHAALAPLSAGTDTCRSQRHPRNQVLSGNGRSARVRGPNDAVPVTGGRRDTRSVKRSFVASAPASTSGSAAPSCPRSRILPSTPVRLTEAMGLPVPTRALWSGLACYVGWFAGRVSHVSAETPTAPSGESRSMIMLTSMVLPLTRRAARRTACCRALPGHKIFCQATSIRQVATLHRAVLRANSSDVTRSIMT